MKDKFILPKNYIWAGTFKKKDDMIEDVVNFFNIDFKKMLNLKKVIIEELSYIGKNYFALYIHKSYITSKDKLKEYYRNYKITTNIKNRKI